MSTHLVPGIVLSVLHVSPLLILITVWNVNTIVILILRLVKVRYCKVTWVEHNLNPISLSWDSVLFNSTVQLPEEPQLPILDWWQCFLSVSPLNTSGALLFIQLLRFSQWCFCNFWCIIKGRRKTMLDFRTTSSTASFLLKLLFGSFVSLSQGMVFHVSVALIFIH